MKTFNKKSIIKILPGNKRLKQLIKEHGDLWQVLEFKMSVQCFGNSPGYWIKSTDENTHMRWVEQEFITSK